MSFVLVRGSVGAGKFAAGHGKHGSSFDESQHDIDLGNIVIEFFHEVFRDQIGESYLVLGIL